MPMAELSSLFLLTGYMGRAAGRARILAIFDGFHPFETFQPDFAAIQTAYGTNIARKSPALDCDGLAID